MGVFSDYNGQLHVSACNGHLQVVLEELNLKDLTISIARTWCRDLYIGPYLQQVKLLCGGVLGRYDGSVFVRRLVLRPSPWLGCVVLLIIVSKYIYCDTVVFDYIQFPSFIHTTGMTHFLNVRGHNRPQEMWHQNSNQGSLLSAVEMGVTCGRFIKYPVAGQYRVIQDRSVATFYHLMSLIFKSLRPPDQKFQAPKSTTSKPTKLK